MGDNRKIIIWVQYLYTEEKTKQSSLRGCYISLQRNGTRKTK